MESFLNVMSNKRKIIAVIPARGGSKRLPGKNTKLFCGKPLISWTIEAAKKSKYLDEILITSDDSSILEIANKYGVSFIDRPKSLAIDTANTSDVLLHALSMQNLEFDFVILLQPTSPLRSHKQIDEAIELLFEKSSVSIVSVCECEHSPVWSNRLPGNFSMKGFVSEGYEGARSQDIDIYYRLNGAIYIIDITVFKKLRKLLIDDSYAYVMNTENSIDIDTIYDFVCAESLMNFNFKK